jgi:SAM-dependent methyltransferase
MPKTGKTSIMNHPNRGFVIPNSLGGFSIDPMKVSPESIFVTEILLDQLQAARQLAQGVMLDVGCGTKPYRELFARQVTHHWGVDVPFSYHGNRAIDCFAPSHALPLRSGSVDFVLCTEVLEHVPEPWQAWNEISRVLRPGGVALITTPFIYRFHEMPWDFWRITGPCHRRMAERAGLMIEDIRPRGGYLSVLADVKLKGLAFAVRLIRKLLRRPTQPGPITRRFFAMIQKPLFWLLRKERLKSDEFTIGLVVIARKPRPHE